jgi:hypothetical protein
MSENAGEMMWLEESWGRSAVRERESFSAKGRAQPKHTNAYVQVVKVGFDIKWQAHRLREETLCRTLARIEAGSDTSALLQVPTSLYFDRVRTIIRHPTGAHEPLRD